jgi:hypothetical protein
MSQKEVLMNPFNVVVRAAECAVYVFVCCFTGKAGINLADKLTKPESETADFGSVYEGMKKKKKRSGMKQSDYPQPKDGKFSRSECVDFIGDHPTEVVNSWLKSPRNGMNTSLSEIFEERDIKSSWRRGRKLNSEQMGAVWDYLMEFTREEKEDSEDEIEAVSADCTE